MLVGRVLDPVHSCAGLRHPGAATASHKARTTRSRSLHSVLRRHVTSSLFCLLFLQETEAKLSSAHLARVDVANMPGMIEGIEGAVAPLVRVGVCMTRLRVGVYGTAACGRVTLARACVQVHDMLDRTWAELMLYERVVRTSRAMFNTCLCQKLC
jgi:hypothetical protein